MPARNAIKIYSPDSFYHIYNRGVEKRLIFLDSQDYSVFLSFLKDYLLPKDSQKLMNVLASHEASYKEKYRTTKLLALKNFSSSIDLVAYALMPNHFHLLIRQIPENAIDKFMRALCTRYASYFNRKYHRVGGLFQGVYKAVQIKTDEQLLHLSRYIHLNPQLSLDRKPGFKPDATALSSLPDYLGNRNTSWLKKELVLNYFKKAGNYSYSAFIDGPSDPESIAKLTIDLESN